MTEYIYEIQAFAWSDFQHDILTHTKKYTKEELEEIILEARSKLKIDRNILGHKDSSNYPNDLIGILKREYGFKKSNHLVAYVGCYASDKIAVEVEEGIFMEMQKTY